MKKDFVSIVMNPVRQRIILFLAIHAQGTVADIAQSLSDIPKPSLYRHIKQLLDGGIIEVAEEKAIRGTIERTYILHKQTMANPPNVDPGLIIQQALMSIAATFAGYFAGENPEPVKDMLCVSSSTLMLSDEEFGSLLMKISELYKEHFNNESGNGRKARNITLISSPTNLD